jgi:hypothetical protein
VIERASRRALVHSGCATRERHANPTHSRFNEPGVGMVLAMVLPIHLR